MRTRVIVACALALAVGVIGVGVATAASQADEVSVIDCLAERGVDGSDVDGIRTAVEQCAGPLREQLAEVGACVVERQPNPFDLEALRQAAEACGLGEDELRERLELERGALEDRLEGFRDCLAGQGVVVPTDGSEVGEALLALLGLDREQLRGAYEACRGELPFAPSLRG